MLLCKRRHAADSVKKGPSFTHQLSEEDMVVRKKKKNLESMDGSMGINVYCSAQQWVKDLFVIIVQSCGCVKAAQTTYHVSNYITPIKLIKLYYPFITVESVSSFVECSSIYMASSSD